LESTQLHCIEHRRHGSQRVGHHRQFAAHLRRFDRAGRSRFTFVFGRHVYFTKSQLLEDPITKAVPELHEPFTEAAREVTAMLG